MSSPPLNDSLIVETKYDCNRVWIGILEIRDLTATQEARFARTLETE